MAAGNAFLPSQKLPLQVKEGEEEKDEDGGGKILFDSFPMMIRLIKNNTISGMDKVG